MLVWYFDYLSPYSYLQFEAYPELMRDAELRPLLFAGLLKQWGTKGPAEIEQKRLQTYRFTYWQAQQHGITLKYPPAHPFNPVPALRLTIALGGKYEVVKTIFEFIWKEGRSVDEEWAALCAKLNCKDADTRIQQQSVKDALADNGKKALERGVYGVPTMDTGKELFWGLDATEMLLDYLADPKMFDNAEMQRIANLPVAAARKS